MKNGYGKYCLTVLFSSTVMFNAFSQRILSEYDSIPISKPRMIQDTYHLNHHILNEITVVKRKPKAADDIPRGFLGNFSEGAFTLLTGVNTSSSDSSLWMTNNELTANDADYTWNIHLFFPGELRKSRERVKNDDGSTSVETDKWIEVDWRKGAYGLIVEKNDTIGRFTMVTNLQSEPESLDWLSRLEKESTAIRSKLEKHVPGQMNDDFNISGSFYGKSFTIISSGRNYKSIILVENTPLGIFQSKPDIPFIGKKNRIESYLLINKALSGNMEIDLFRLSMLSRLITKTIAEDSFNK